jgi:hypothetical protein
LTDPIPKSEAPTDANKSKILERLKLSYEERIAAHENARRLAEDLKKAGEALNAEPSATP